MAVTSSNLILGPAELYVGDFGAVEPTAADIDSAPSDSVWTATGGTLDGVTITINQEFTELMVDQVSDNIGRRMTKRDFSIETNLAEPTLQNLVYVMNNSTDPTENQTDKVRTVEVDNVGPHTELPYKALILDGQAPNASRRRIIIRKALSTDNVEFAYTKDEQTVYTAGFCGQWVSSSVKPCVIMDHGASIEDPTP